MSIRLTRLRPAREVARWHLPVAEAADGGADVLAMLGGGAAGLDVDEAARRRAAVGPNAVRTHHTQPLRVLGRQLRSPVLILLTVTATVSAFLGVHRRAARFSVGR
jgi:Mg2+-importing ATPase